MNYGINNYRGDPEGLNISVLKSLQCDSRPLQFIYQDKLGSQAPLFRSRKTNVRNYTSSPKRPEPQGY